MIAAKVRKAVALSVTEPEVVAKVVPLVQTLVVALIPLLFSQTTK
jgi:hypothetical protein